MMNIFNIFDPSTSMKFSLNWLSMLIFLVLMPYQFWFIPSRFIMFWMLILSFLTKEFKVLIKYSYSNIIIFLSLFVFILMNNFLGLFPYIFTASSHMSFCFSMSITMWLGMMIYGWLNFYNDMFSHLTPQGTPVILMPFMVMIETISLIIRPLTLAIRLSANMIAGHLLMSLLGSTGSSMFNYMLIILIFTQILLLTLELSVSIIQAYVFSILSTLYSSEI
uniref:ATP synthase F0 subunit 6 n=1 Tax=Paraponera clavata TaxID=55425 RepID=UPI002A80DA84|nr:ATP synthase F0 subunit 6 [Paraponera clavata]WNO15838.1 ATP synthase F0 subunit 6 [Paraponera clavata]